MVTKLICDFAKFFERLGGFVRRHNTLTTPRQQPDNSPTTPRPGGSPPIVGLAVARLLLVWRFPAYCWSGGCPPRAFCSCPPIVEFDFCYATAIWHSSFWGRFCTVRWMRFYRSSGLQRFLTGDANVCVKFISPVVFINDLFPDSLTQTLTLRLPTGRPGDRSTFVSNSLGKGRL